MYGWINIVGRYKQKLAYLMTFKKDLWFKATSGLNLNTNTNIWSTKQIDKEIVMLQYIPK